MRLLLRFHSQFTLKNSFGDCDTAAAHRRVASNAASRALVTAQMEMQFLADTTGVQLEGSSSHDTTRTTLKVR